MEVKASVIEAAKITESSGNRIQKAHTEFREADLILTTLDEVSINFGLYNYSQSKLRILVPWMV